ncbi:MAG: hypothetical protein GU361_05675 [Desulfurococcales archaeon]|jgi:predicted aspartyl protease|nr:hypothetical protein [Desulfurococcales archaeon]
MIRNLFTSRSISVKALVGTEAIFTVIPRKIAVELQLPVICRRRATTVKGVTELDECVGMVEVMGRKAYSHILVSDGVDIVLIGSVTLETLGLEVEPVTGRLKESKT